MRLLFALPETGWVDQGTARLVTIVCIVGLVVLLGPPVLSAVRPRVQVTRPTVRVEAPPIVRHWRARDESSGTSSPTDHKTSRIDVARTTVAREIVAESPDDLLAFFEDHTSYQAAALVKPWLGRWMRVSGRVSNVSEFTTLAQLSFERADRPSPVLCYFRDRRWADRLARLKRGDEVSVLGRIDRVTQTTVDLMDCELVDD